MTSETVDPIDWSHSSLAPLDHSPPVALPTRGQYPLSASCIVFIGAAQPPTGFDLATLQPSACETTRLPMRPLREREHVLGLIPSGLLIWKLNIINKTVVSNIVYFQFQACKKPSPWTETTCCTGTTNYNSTLLLTPLPGGASQPASSNKLRKYKIWLVKFK